MKQFKKKKNLFIAPLALFTLFMPMVPCACANNSDQKPKKNDGFIGFENNQITYDFPTVTGVIKKNVPIKKVSDTYYVTNEPLDVFVNGSTNLNFAVVVKDQSVSRRVRYYLDKTQTIHAVSLIGTNFTYDMPLFSIYDDKVKNDAIFVAFECDSNIVFKINLRIWRSSFPTNVNLSYQKTSTADKHSVIATAGNGYEATLLCNKNGYSLSLTNTMIINCMPLYSEYADLYFNIESYESEQTRIFDLGINYSLTTQKIVSDNEYYYQMFVSYTFFANASPTYDEAKGITPIIFRLNIYREPKFESVLSFCDFRICWI